MAEFGKLLHRRSFLIGVFIALLALVLVVRLQEWTREVKDAGVKTLPFSQRPASVSPTIAETTTASDDGASSSAESASAESSKCSITCTERQEQHLHRWGGNLADSQHLLQAVTQAREKFIDKLKIDYGSYFDDIFTVNKTISRGRLVIRPVTTKADGTEAVSTLRFKRKLKMKLLQVQIRIQEQDKDVHGCDCTANPADERNQGKRQRFEGIVSDKNDVYFAHFVWGTGGHSAAAGHGNLYNESYTAYLERGAQNIFHAVGIDFEGRNYAMGGASSSPELALCSEAVYGIDADMISWDFGMTDGQKWWKNLMYASRTGLNPNRPAALILDLVRRNLGGKFDKRIDEVKKLERQGLTAFYTNSDQVDEMKNAIPDMFGMTTEEMDAVPDYIRHYKCNDMIEKGDPTCQVEKYSKFSCQNRDKRKSWHPGWKDHALNGNILALFLADMLLDAAQEIATSTETPESILTRLKGEEDASYQQLLHWNMSDPFPGVDPEVAKEIPGSVAFKSPSICHFARIPAQTRYRGILTESNTTGVKGYDEGIPLSLANESLSREQTGALPIMPLTYDDDTHPPECEIPTFIDRNDYFYTRHGAGWHNLIVPNEAERKEYGRDGNWNPHGIVVVCLLICPWKKCPPHVLRLEALVNGTLKMQVNRQNVIDASPWDTECYLLRGEQGYVWKANEAGAFELRVRVDGDDELAFVKISSLIIL